MAPCRNHVVRSFLRVAGAAVVLQVRRAMPRDRLATSLVLGGLALAFADAIDGSRGTTALLEGASAALRELS